MSILRTEKLCKSFSNGGVQQHVIKNLDLEITDGDFTVIMGSIGVLEALGYRSREISGAYIYEYLLLSLLGILIGGLLMLLMLTFVTALGKAGKIKKYPPVVAFRKGIKTHHFGRNVFPIEKTKSDINRMNQVIGNIITNSYKYADTKIEVDYSVIDDYLEMKIRDFGPGISEEELPAVTNKFYRGKNAEEKQKEGSGLGLYISKSLMEKMDGELICERADESGGFSVKLLIQLS